MRLLNNIGSISCCMISILLYIIRCKVGIKASFTPFSFGFSHKFVRLIPNYSDMKYRFYAIVYMRKTPYLCTRKHLVIKSDKNEETNV